MPARMVRLVVGDDRRGQVRDPLVLELAAKVVARAARRPRARAAVGRVEQDRIALADVEHDDAQARPRARPAFRPTVEGRPAPGRGPPRQRRQARGGLTTAGGLPRPPRRRAQASSDPEHQAERDVRGQHPGGAGQRDARPRPARRAEPVCDLRDVGGQQPREAGQWLHREPGQLADQRGQHPQPHQRRHGGQHQQIRGHGRERNRLEVVRHQRGRGERRGDRHRRRPRRGRAASRRARARLRPRAAPAGRRESALPTA